MCACDLSFWRQKAAEYSLSAAKQCSAVKYNSVWPYGHTPITILASTKGFKGGLAWIKPSKKDMAVTFSYSPLEY